MAKKSQEIEQYKTSRAESLQSNNMRLTKTSKIKGLVAHFPLEGPTNDLITNTVMPNKSGKIIDPVNSKIANEQPTIIEGKFGDALKLSGDDALSFPGIGRFSRAEPFSIGLWVKIPSELKHGVIFHSNKGSALYTYKGYQVSVEEDKFDVRLAHNFPYNAIHLLSIDPVPRDQWIHLMLTYDGFLESIRGQPLFGF